MILNLLRLIMADLNSFLDLIYIITDSQIKRNRFVEKVFSGHISTRDQMLPSGRVSGIDVARDGLRRLGVGGLGAIGAAIEQFTDVHRVAAEVTPVDKEQATVVREDPYAVMVHNSDSAHAVVFLTRFARVPY